MIFRFHRIAARLRNSSEELDFNQRRRDAWVAEMASLLPAGSRVLDAGAGKTPYRRHFDHCLYQTHDFAQYQGTQEGLMADSWHYGKIDFVGDIASIPVASESFDVVLCTEVLEHVPEPIAAIAEFSRILRPGGTVLLTAPLGSGAHQEPFHYYGGFTRHFYATMLPRFDIEMVEIHPNGGFFRHYMQETARATDILLSQPIFRSRSLTPVRHAARLTLKLLAVALVELDDRIFLDEFTVGFFVVGRKKLSAVS
jgi:ubiquinone/menaquinone biosynthesis C-methylase UbiE